MKTVFSNSMCAHVWAQRSQDHGRSDSMRFAGNVLYSYETPIANFTPEGVALISSHSYSVTTNGKHILEARRAVCGESFTVPDIGASGGRARTARARVGDKAASWRPVHEANLAWLVERRSAEIVRLLRIQSWNWDCWDDVFNTVRDAGTVANYYAETFGLPAPGLDAKADATRIWERCKTLDAKRADPAYAAKTEKAREQREAAKARKAERERAEAAQREADRRSLWLEGAWVPAWRGTDEHGGAYLRVRGDNVETSLGASVPLEDARRVFRFVTAKRKLSPAMQRQGLDYGSDAKLGHFTLDSFDEKGIRAGCHFISWSEIERIAPQLREGVQS